jgi:hypothetical protein
MLSSQIESTIRRILLVLSILLAPLIATSRAQEDVTYQYIPGGTLDLTTNLIWSYDLQVVDWRISGRHTLRTNSYAAATWVGLGEDTVTYSQWLQNTYSAPELTEFYPNGTDGWRLPTLEEAEAAVGSGFFLIHDADPYADFQWLGSDYGDSEPYFKTSSWYHTSTPAKGFKGGDAFHFINLHILDPQFGEVRQGRTACNAILVRSASSSGGGGSGGGGGGKGKK